jgi:hypothetical protein
LLGAEEKRLRRFASRWLGWRDKSDIYVFLAVLLFILLSARVGILLGAEPLVPVNRASVPLLVSWSLLYDVAIIALSVALMLIASRSRPPWPPSKAYLVLLFPPILSLLQVRFPFLSVFALIALGMVLAWKIPLTKSFRAASSAIAIISTWLLILCASQLLLGEGFLRLNLPLYVYMAPQPASGYLLLASLSIAIVAFASAALLGESGQVEGRSDRPLLLLSIITGLLVYMLPYTRVANPGALVATTDIPLYAQLLEKLTSSPSPLREAFSSSPTRLADRPLYMLVLLALHRITGYSSTATATISGWLWTPILIASVWALARQLYDNRTASIAAFLTAVGYQTLAFVYGGLQANQLNLAVLFLAMAILAKPSLPRALLASLLLLASSMLHLWSWAQIAPAIIAWVILSPRAGSIKNRLACLAVIAVPMIVSLSIYSYMLGDTPSTITHSVMRIIEKNDAYTITEKIGGIERALSIYLWGTLSNPLLLLLGLVGAVLLVADRRGDPSLAVMSLSLPMLLLVSPDMTFVSRLMVNVPVQIPAAYALSRLDKRLAYSLMLYMLAVALYFSLNAVPR